jgi:deoxyribodipyrimidine photo-lyase
MSIALVWLRQDLRCFDNPALASACDNHQIVIPLYILDDETNQLGSAQTWWLHHSLLSLEKELRKRGLQLFLRRGNPLEELFELIKRYDIDTVYWNRCYEPSAIERDTFIKNTLKEKDISVITSNGSLIHEPWTIKNKSGNYFKVFTPFWRHSSAQIIIPDPITLSGKLQSPPPIPESFSERLDEWKLLPDKPDWASDFHHYWEPGEKGAQKKLDHFITHFLRNYKDNRNEPGKNATSKLSPHLHFGEISVWQILRAIEHVKVHHNSDLPSIEHFLSEIGWREFAYYLLYHFPELPDKNFKNQFDAFPWHINEELLKRWKEGTTGYPIVDAGMRELWKTGYMQNRVRMITASFLTKDLLIDWRIGAAWFFDTLLDADLANNSAGWQWVAGSGADASPYFRIFNPVLQGEKFDPDGTYIRQWVPELSNVPNKWIHKPWAAPQGSLGVTLGKEYPYPIVDHGKAREQALLQYRMLR